MKNFLSVFLAMAFWSSISTASHLIVNVQIDDPESKLEGVEVALMSGDVPIQTATTNSDGNADLGEIAAGTYTLNAQYLAFLVSDGEELIVSSVADNQTYNIHWGPTPEQWNTVVVHYLKTLADAYVNSPDYIPSEDISNADTQPKPQPAPAPEPVPQVTVNPIEGRLTICFTYNSAPVDNVFVEVTGAATGFYGSQVSNSSGCVSGIIPFDLYNGMASKGPDSAQLQIDFRQDGKTCTFNANTGGLSCN